MKISYVRPSLRDVIGAVALCVVVSGLGTAALISNHRYVSSSALLVEMTPTELAELATVIVRGTVTAQSTQVTSDGKGVLTRSVVQVSHAYRGVVGPSVTVTTRGGSSGNLTEISEDQPTLPAGRDVILFLMPSGDDLVPVAGFEGRFFPAQDNATNGLHIVTMAELIAAATSR